MSKNSYKKIGDSYPLNYAVFTLFFFSGAFALVYEVSWVRAITLEFGSTTLAVSTVVCIFMGGLALGAWVIARWLEKFWNPLTKYGIIEIAIALYALLTPLMFEKLLSEFTLLAARFAENIWFLATIRFFASALLLLIPTILMGATLPVLAHFYVRTKDDGAKGGGLLYGVNTVGAFLGTIAAGFILLPGLGLSRTILIVAGCNLLLGIFAYILGKKTERQQDLSSKDIPDPVKIKNEFSDSLYILIAIALTGFAAMACQVVWTRVITLVIGGSVYSFSIVLATFLAGLGLGAALVAAILKTDRVTGIRVFYLLAAASAILILLSSIVFQYLPSLFLNWFWSFKLIQESKNIFYVQALITAIVIFVPAFVMGGLFPTAARIIVKNKSSTGVSIARLYTWNTIGSILGLVCTGFVLIPFLGIRISLILIMAVYCLGAVTGSLGEKRNRKPAIGIGAGLFIVLLILTPTWDKKLMTSAMYNYAYHLKKMDNRQFTSLMDQRVDLLYYKDGLTSTVTVTQNTNPRNKAIAIAINGKYDGSSDQDMANQRLLAHFPLLFHHDPKIACVIGLGTGCTAGSAALYPLETVAVVEIEPAVVEGARFFKNDNYAVHDNDKADIRVTDGRLYLRLHANTFDVIISEPSNPWLAGPSDLFTLDFFEIAARALRDKGIFCQWLHLYALSPDNVKTIIRTFNRVFPHTYLINSRPGIDILLLGSQQPFSPDIHKIEQQLNNREIIQDLADPRIGIRNIFDLFARIRLGPKEVIELTGTGPLNSDDHPIIAYNAPKDLYKRTEESNMQLIYKYAKGIAPYINIEDYTVNDKDQFLDRLVFAYRRFVGDSKEIKEIEKLR